MVNNLASDYELDRCYDFEPHLSYQGPKMEELYNKLEKEESIATFTAEKKVGGICFNDAHPGLFNDLIGGVVLAPPISVESRLNENGVQFKHSLYPNI